MLIKITGKNETLEKLDEAKQKIEEAEKILWRLSSEIQLEITEDSTENVKSGSPYKNLCEKEGKLTADIIQAEM